MEAENTPPSGKGKPLALIQPLQTPSARELDRVEMIVAKIIEAILKARDISCAPTGKKCPDTISIEDPALTALDDAAHAG